LEYLNVKLMKRHLKLNICPSLAKGIMVLTLFAGCMKKPHVQKPATNSTAKVLPRPSAPSPGSPIHFDRSKRYIFLTFDDAPQPPGTINCKNVFFEQGVKATFFVVGMHVEIDPLRWRIADSLRSSYPQFLIANHSYSHGFRNNYRKYYNEPENAVQDLMRAQDMLNVPVKIIRLPGNNAWVGEGENKGPHCTLAVRHLLDSMGYKVIGWDVEWCRKGNAAPKQSADEMVKEVNAKLERETTNRPNTIVILAHDRMFGKSQYVDSLVKFVALLKSDSRNVFETVDHYPLGNMEPYNKNKPVSTMQAIYAKAGH
jgi:peptidoglycan-N-acetylglucosamine deacetylase